MRSSHTLGNGFNRPAKPASRGWQFNPICGRNQKKKLRKLTIGVWNVRTLMDREAVARPERRTALIARELVRYNIDITALSETRLPGEGFLSEPGGGYTFFWKGKTETEDRTHGVGLAIKTLLMHQLPDLPVGINERLLKLRFPLNAKRHVTIISAYAPTLTHSDNSKEQFYEDLDRLIKATPVTDKLLLLGDFNARVGADSKNWKGVIGPHGVGKMNSNGLLLLSLCSENDLTITNTLFQQADKYKTTWMHPRSKQWHLIDYAIVRRRDIRNVLITRVMRGAECWTDHRLVRTSLQLYIVPSQHKHCKHFKNKGSKAECGNYRGISLLSVGGKIIARIILNHLIASFSEANLPESQCGFRPGRSTVNMVFAVRQIQGKCIEQNMHLYAVFIDLTKAFDTVNREALWTILTRLGCPRKFVQIIRLFHDSMTGEVLSDGATSAPFNITNGVKQGCVLAPVLFNLFFACVLNHTLKDLDRGIYLKYRHDGSLFDLRCLNAK
ncbi:craniofacial development protein 2-like, partial [Terrapene carolina triunguis]|uniref:craniofacial development protein 2-like n=1 Tax=Terrapene triunguis TaxID=2587831 RepID=UPI000E776F0A